MKHSQTTTHPTSTHCFSGWNIAKLLENQSGARPDKTFLIWDDHQGGSKRWTFKNFYSEARRLAGGLHERGVKNGDSVTIFMHNRPEFLFGYFACAILGATAVTPNRRSTANELEYFVRKSSSRYVITDVEGFQYLSDIDADLSWIAIAGIEKSETLSEAKKHEVTSFEDLPAAGDVAIAADPKALDPAGVQFTSGTTSKPKGVVFTQANVLWAGRVNASHIGIDENDVTLVIAPLFHVNALFYSVMASLWAGASVVLVPKFSLSNFWKTVNRYNVTWMSIQPFAARALLTQPVPEHSIRFMGLGAADVGFIEQHLKSPTIGWWGMTETISHPIVTAVGWRSRLMSMGRPAPEYEIKIIDENGDEVSPSAQGVRGRLMVKGIRGVSLFLEYLDDEEATSKSFDIDGWFDTGDLVVVYEDGEILFGDREKDMLRVGGENVSASEVEQCIAQVPGVVEVAVVAERHEMLDEVAVAFVIANGSYHDVECAIRNQCEAELSDFKIPRKIIFLNDFPRSLLDKVSKSELRKRLAGGSNGF